MGGCATLCELVLAFFLPPLGVCLRCGCCSVEFWICLVLTILAFVPGIIYAFYVILKFMNASLFCLIMVFSVFCFLLLDIEERLSLKKIDLLFKC